MYKLVRKNVLPVIFIISLLVAGCDLNNSDDEPDIAQAGVEIYFTEAESGDPVADADVEVRAVYAGEAESVTQGSVATDADGNINAVITNPEEVTITTLIFLVDYENEEYSFEEEGLDLDLTYNEPFDSVVLEYEVDTSTDNSGDE